MNLVLTVLLAAAVLGYALYLAVKLGRNRGKGGCGSCAGCSQAGWCNQEKAERNKKK